MESFYADAAIEVRADLGEAHRAVVTSWARAGNHWNATERAAIVAEVRRARAHRHDDALPAWVRPTTVDGLVDADSPLPDAAIDAVWRLSNHSGTLTEDWYRDIIERGLTPGHYVELVGVVATANCIDTFATAIGVTPRPLPTPAEARPDGLIPAGVEVSTHWVPTVPGPGANVAKALTSVPVAADAWQTLSAAQYVPAEAVVGDLTWTRGEIDRLQVELLAARTSLLNECFY